MNSKSSLVSFKDFLYSIEHLTILPKLINFTAQNRIALLAAMLKTQPIPTLGRLWSCGEEVFVEVPSSAANLSSLLATVSLKIWPALQPSLLEPTHGRHESLPYEKLKTLWYWGSCFRIYFKLGVRWAQLDPPLWRLRVLSRSDRSRLCTEWGVVWLMVLMANSLTLPSLKLTRPSPWMPLWFLQSCPMTRLQLEQSWLSVDGAPQLRVRLNFQLNASKVKAFFAVQRWSWSDHKTKLLEFDSLAFQNFTHVLLYIIFEVTLPWLSFNRTLDHTY